MTSPLNSVPAPIGSNAHRLQGRALRQWWQTPFEARDNKYRNDMIRQHIIILACLPAFAAGAYHIMGAEFFKIGLLTAVMWLVDLVLFFKVLQSHGHIPLAVVETDDSLFLQSPFFKRQVRFSDVRDFFELDNGDYVLEYSRGEQFILSSELSDGPQLFQTIRKKVPKPAVVYDRNFRLGEQLFDSTDNLLFAVFIFVLFPLLRTLLYGGHPSIGWYLGATAALVAGVFIYTRMMSSMVQLVRMSPTSILIGTRRGRRVVSWDQVVELKQSGGCFSLKLRDGRFVILAGRQGGLCDKLLEQKKLLPSPTRRNPA